MTHIKTSNKIIFIFKKKNEIFNFNHYYSLNIFM